MGEAGVARRGAVGEVFFAFLRLGLTAFGGPVAHIGFFRDEFVGRRRWLDDAAFADLVALCQFLPGPASSQLGMALGLLRAGRAGALAAWVGFTAPSAVAMTALALGFVGAGVAMPGVHGLKVAAVAVVAAALIGMIRSLAPDRARGSVAVAATAVAVAIGGALGQVAAIGLGAVVGLAVLPREAVTGAVTTGAAPAIVVGRGEGAAALVLFAVATLGLPLIAAASGTAVAAMVDAFWRAGALVFGGGHVVLPLLEAETVARGRVTADVFVAGYGLAQAMPGPLFTFAAWLGTVWTPGPGGIVGAAVAIVAIFAPSALLVAGVLPFWERLRRDGRVRAALGGINAAVVGLLAVAFHDPVWRRGVLDAGDFVTAAAGFVALVGWRAPPWAVVAATAAIAAGRAALG